MKLQYISAIPIFIDLKNLNEPVLFCFPDKQSEEVFEKSLLAFRIKFSKEIINRPEKHVYIQEIKDIFREISISESYLDIKIGQEIRPSEIINFLIENGYKRVPESPYSDGEFSNIGDTFDIRVKNLRIRIEILFDKVEKIYTISPPNKIERKEKIYIHSLSQKSSRKIYELFSEIVSFCDSWVCPEHSKGKIKEKLKEIEKHEILSPRDFIRNKDDVFELIKRGYNVKFLVKYSYEENTLKEYFGRSVDILRSEDYNFGFIIPATKYAFIPFDVFYSKDKKKKTSLKLPPITYEDLKESTYVVHKVHGIGIFRGTSLEQGREFLKIEYRNSAFLYIPAEDIGLIHKYIGIENPILDEIGGRTFAIRLSRVKQYIEKQISDSMRLLAIKKTVIRPPYRGAEEILAKIEETFPYDETDDQKKAIDEIVFSLTNSENPIDYLVVGDSGVGKTEIAIRAISIVAYSGRQTAFVAPTTVLALQHFIRISQRLQDFPFKIAMLSRLTPKKKEKEIIQQMKSGDVDIVIGTHKLINALPHFKDLGLLVLDEEHRFGTEQKEKIARIKASCDVISLSATPIPRSLKMALTGLKDIAIIRTKPTGRGLIITSFLDQNKIKDAIDFELKRGGQVIYITPYIEGQSETLAKIHNMFNDVPISILHGGMKSNEIEKILLLFMIGQIRILIATKIVSLGIDIPNVNTMIIERADLFGLSELYQLRGRVGRGDKDAFCYLMVPEKIGKEAKNRLDIFIETVNFKEEGIGLHLSLKDIEMRGAGNLFGKEQVGHIYSIGFDAYVEILKEFIEEIKGKRSESISFEPMVKIDLPAYIPSEIIPDNMLRISFYRAFANCESIDDVEEVYRTIKYRFIGEKEIPEEIENFVKISKLKILMRKNKIYSAVFSQDLTSVELETKDGKMKIPTDGIDGLISLLLSSSSDEARIHL